MASPADDNPAPHPGQDPIQLARAVRVTVPEGWRVEVVHGESFSVELLVDLADRVNPFVPTEGQTPPDHDSDHRMLPLSPNPPRSPDGIA